MDDGGGRFVLNKEIKDSGLDEFPFLLKEDLQVVVESGGVEVKYFARSSPGAFH